MMTRRLSSLLSLMVLMAACASSPAAPTPETVTLAPGQSVEVNGATVSFVRVLSDSRCPINALCIHAGDAVAEFHVSARGLDARLELHTHDQNKRSGQVRGLSLELTTLAPYPETTSPIPPGDYRATITVK